MNDWFFKRRKTASFINPLGIDSWLDSSLATLWQRFVDHWNASTSFFARFRLSGWKRLANEAVSEAMTLGAGGLVVLYALALPTLSEVDEDRYLATGRYSVRFLDRHGNEIGRRGINHSDSVPLEQFPPHLIHAVLATEDRRFFEHYGIDVLGTLRALVENLRAGETVQGGSTLTQQLAKNLFLTSERSLQRKIKELFLSFWLETRLSKLQILKLYLDRAYMGGGAVGAEAAAQFYFGKSIRDVSMAESAMLAGLFKAPTKYAPHINPIAARSRANEVLSNLVEAGFYTAAQVHEARMSPARHIETRALYSPDWFLDWAFEEIQRVAEGRGHYVLTARTTIDVGLQQAADAALTDAIREHGRGNNARTGALVSMEPDGAVRALVGGLDYEESQFNRATQARRQPGSSFKVYVYAAAMEKGYTPKSIVRDSPVSCGNWSPQNYDGGSGSGRSLSVGQAFALSLNTVAVELSLSVDRDRVLEMTQRLGVQGVRKTCSMALGDTGITPLQHTGAYATFANGGMFVQPYAILEIFNSKGELIYSREKDERPPQRVIQTRVVEHMNQIMQMVVTEGTGKRATLDFTYSCGKTGTSSSYRDAWFVGFTGSLVTGVWIGNDENRPMNKITGGSIPTIAWHNFMAQAHPNLDIPQIPGLPVHATQVAERQRIAELKKTEAAAAVQGRPEQRRAGGMTEQTRELMKRIHAALRSALGAGAGGAPPRSDAPTASPKEKQAVAPAALPWQASTGAPAAAPGEAPGPLVKR